MFQRSAAVRQAWIVLEWLERNAQDQMEDLVMSQLQYFSESTVAWENTLSSLQTGKAGPNMVRELELAGAVRQGGTELAGRHVGGMEALPRPELRARH